MQTKQFLHKLEIPFSQVIKHLLNTFKILNLVPWQFADPTAFQKWAAGLIMMLDACNIQIAAIIKAVGKDKADNEDILISALREAAIKAVQKDLTLSEITQRILALSATADRLLLGPSTLIGAAKWEWAETQLNAFELQKITAEQICTACSGYRFDWTREGQEGLYQIYQAALTRQQAIKQRK